MTTSDMQPSMSCVFIQLKYHNNEEHEKPVCDTRNTVYHSPWQRNIGGYVWLFFASRGRSCTPVASRLHPPLSSHNAIFSCSSTLHTRAPSEDHSRCISSLFQSDNHFDNLRLCLVLCSFRLLNQQLSFCDLPSLFTMTTLGKLRYALSQGLRAEHLSLRYPIIQAPMSPITSPSLVAAVSAVGALGSLAGARMSPAQLKQDIARIRTLTSQPFAVNLFVPKEAPSYSAEDVQQIAIVMKKVHRSVHREDTDNVLPSLPDPSTSALSSSSSSDWASSARSRFEQQVDVLLADRVPVFSWTFGIPSVDILQECKRNGIFTVGTATSPLEAWTLATTPHVDAIVVQGSEAGGHRGSFLTTDNTSADHAIGLMSLLPLVREVVPQHVLLIAAGGIMDGRSMIAAMLLGAHAVQMGTAFLTCTESSMISAAHKELLLRSYSLRTSQRSAAEIVSLRHSLAESYLPTVLTRVFSGRPARGVHNQMIDAFKDVQRHLLPWDVQSSVVQPYAKAAADKKQTAFMQVWAGQAYPFCRERTAGQLIESVMEEARGALS